MERVTPTRHRTVPIRESMTTLGNGYPEKLCLFQIQASSFWWVRYFSNGRIVKRSTKTTHLREAKEFAKRFYEEILLRERNLLPASASPTFDRCATELLEEQEQRIQRGELNKALNTNDRSFLKSIAGTFSGMDIKQIGYKQINNYLATLASKGLSTSTQKKHLQLISKILKLAHRENLLDRLPTLPVVKIKDSPRGWFNPREYEQLRKTAVAIGKKPVTVRSHEINDEMRLLVTFMINTFLRPSDLKYLRHRNIEVVKSDSTYLRITTERAKTKNTPVVTMQNAVGIYKDLCDLRSEVHRDDFVFYPQFKENNRDQALNVMGRHFDYVVRKADLKTSASGESRTLYSLRHTAIMFRIQNSENLDLLTLAKNARTSVEVIQRFYGSHHEAEKNIESIQSMKKLREKVELVDNKSNPKLKKVRKSVQIT